MLPEVVRECPEQFEKKAGIQQSPAVRQTQLLDSLCFTDNWPVGDRLVGDIEERHRHQNAF